MPFLLKTAFLGGLALFSLSLTTCKDSRTIPTRPLPPLPNVDITKTRIVIDKSDYQLKLYEVDKLLRTYPIVLGFEAVKDKYQEGDGATPEGKFKVRTKYDHAKWSKFIWIDYPTADSYRKFDARKASGKVPQDASIGGEIGIHGVPLGQDAWITERYNWTLGCISLSRSNVDELYGLIQDGSEILIQP